jgi:predicted DNA-binding protein (MmcQ/YjbR family)
MSCCPGCHDDDCDGVRDQAAIRAAEWMNRKRYSPVGLPKETQEAIEEMIHDMEAGDA